MRPQVVAHRGNTGVNSEHTLASYVAALDEGAEALECDVRLTADGHLVCVHDRNLRRTASNEAIVSATELADLDKIDVDVLTLRTLLETVSALPRPVGLAIETKHPTRYAGLVERRLVELLDQFGWLGPDSPVRLMSFSVVALKRLQRLAPALDLVLLVHNPAEWLRARPVVERDWIVGPGIEVLREHPRLVRRIGHRLHCWTVNDVADADLCVDAGVEALITDRPGAMMSHLTRLSV